MNQFLCSIRLKIFYNYQTFFIKLLYLYLNMGRRKKYHTEEDRLEANRNKWKRWYDKNKETINKKRMEEYYGKKNSS
jgi:hypothetical protein